MRGLSVDAATAKPPGSRGTDPHNFWIWIRGSDQSLDTIVEVVYKFPESFAPELEEGDRHMAFGDAETDASITLKAKIRFKAGNRLTLTHRVSVPGLDITRTG